MNVRLRSQDARILAEAAQRIGRGGQALALFGETDPELAAECGVEIGALEARTILAGGSIHRVALEAGDALARGRDMTVAQADLDAFSRLGAVVALGNARIQIRMSALQAEETQGSMAQLGSMLGLATGAVSLIKTIF